MVHPLPPDLPEVLVACRLADRLENGHLHIAKTTARIWGIARALAFFRPDLTVLALPPWDCLPYDRRSPSAQRTGHRAASLARLTPPVPARVALITTAGAALQRVPPPESFLATGLHVRRGVVLDAAALETWLEDTGYAILPIANEPGEAALREDRVDVFPPDAARPLRLDIDDGRLVSIRPFDPLSQRGDTCTVDEDLFLPPAAELILTPTMRSRFLEGYTRTFGADTRTDFIYRCVADGYWPSGLEHWLPLAHERMPTVFDLFGDAGWSCDGDVHSLAGERLEEIKESYETRRAEKGGADQGLPVYRPLDPERLYLTTSEWTTAAEKLVPIDPGPARVHPVHASVEDGLAWMKVQRNDGRRVLALAASRGERSRLQRLFSRSGIAAAFCKDWSEAQAASVGLAVLDIGRGFSTADQVVVTARELDPHAPPPAHAGTARRLAHDMTELVIGDIVAHADYGIGRYDGLETVAADGLLHDCVRLLYHDDETVLVPVEQADLIWRYGPGSADVTLDRLHSPRWNKRVDRAREDARRLAEDLVRREKRRRAIPASALRAPDVYARFAHRFPHVETPDQQRAIRDVLGDLASGSPMDRLVCGDVGFGKTEVALRAAFVVASHGKQVAVVAPTTPLCRQHAEDFRQRLRPFGIKVGLLTRTVSRAETDAVKEGLRSGALKVCIGTQALLAAAFADLALLVVDEEHRLGAQQKERLARAHPALHVLTMTATPIPRTLQGALLDLRDTSVLATPPVERRAVRTVVQAFDATVVRHAIQRERRRGGQCFYVCPRIEDLEPLRQRLEGLISDLSVAVAHARLRPSDLDDIMIGFANGRWDLLLSTNIIEAGLNVPNANTLFVHRADLFGLAQLHQLRGRVGRTGRAAHAYLLHDPGEALSDGAQERLETLRAFSEPGAGLLLAVRDRDLRGGGALFADIQSGRVKDVGGDLLQEILRQELLRARGQTAAAEHWVPRVSFGTSVHIPEHYIAEPDLRFNVYRRIAAAENPETLETELVDRFGALPPEVGVLLAVAAVKRLAREKGVEEIAAGPRGAVLTFRVRAPSCPPGLTRRDERRLVAHDDWPDAGLRAAALISVLRNFP